MARRATASGETASFLSFIPHSADPAANPATRLRQVLEHARVAAGGGGTGAACAAVGVDFDASFDELSKLASELEECLPAAGAGGGGDDDDDEI